MPLNPLDVQQKTFGTALRGYDLDEVDDFLDSVVTAFKDFESQLTESRDRIAELESRLADRSDSEGAIARALVAAQRAADMITEESKALAAETLEGAKAEAEKTLEDARGQAGELVESREAEEEALRVEIAGIRERAAALRAKVKGLLEDAALDIEAVSARVAELEEAVVEEKPVVEEEAAEEAVEEAVSEEESAEDDSEEEESVDEVSVEEVEEETSVRPWERG